MSMATTAPSRRETQTSSVKPRILIVEDETALVELLRYNLEQAGFSVAVAYDDDFCDSISARHDHGADRDRLCAGALRVGRVLDVAAGDDLAGFGLDGRADFEPGVRSVRTRPSGPRGLKEGIQINVP